LNWQDFYLKKLIATHLTTVRVKNKLYVFQNKIATKSKQNSNKIKTKQQQNQNKNVTKS